MLVPSANGTIDALARCRQSVLRQATTLFRGRLGIPLTEEFDALPNVSSLLMTSLEELKVAEEELRTQNNLLLERQAAVEERTNHYRRLFLHAPMPALVTDLHGTIHEINLAAIALFRREARRLEQKPIQTLVPLHAREEFRRQLSRVQADVSVTDWHVEFQRVGDVPVSVSAAVSFVPGEQRTSAGSLYWSLRVLG